MSIFLLILGILAIIGSIVVFVIAAYTQKDYSRCEEVRKKRKLAIIVLIAALMLIVLSQSFTIVESGETGLYITMGQVGQEASSGLNWKIPFIQRIERINTKQQDMKVSGQIWSETSTRTAIYYENIIITYQISPDKVSWIYKNVTDYETNLLNASLVSSAVKTASKSLSDENATNRGKIEPMVVEALQSIVDNKYGDNVVFIVNVSIGNCDFEESYQQAIAEKQRAQIEAEKQAIENQKAIEKAEADARVAEINAENAYNVKLKEADAEAEATIKLAEAEATSTVKLAEANAEAYELLTSSLSPEVLKQILLEKWDGKLPLYSGNDSSFIFNMLEDAAD